MNQDTHDIDYRLLFRVAVDPLLLVDDRGRIVSFNAAAAQHFGYSEEEFSRLDVEALVPEAVRESHRERREQYGRAPVPRPRGNLPNLRGHRRDGSLFWADVSLTPVPGGRVLVSVHDVTRRYAAEQALRDSEEQFRATFEQAPIGIGRIGPDGTWLRVNETLRRILGCSVDELAQSRLQDLAHPDDRVETQQLMEFVASGAIDNAHRELRVTRPDGTHVWVGATLSLQRERDGTSSGFQIIVEDIHGRKEAEAALGQLRAEMAEMVKLSVAKHTAMAIAHELNQPLIAVTSYAEAAVRMLRMDAPDPARLKRALEGSAEQAQRASKVVRELLEFLQKGEAATEPVDLNTVVKNALALVDSNGWNGFRTLLDLGPDLRPVQANRLQVEKVLVNLIANGVEAMRDLGLEQQTIRVTIRTMAETNMAKVSVSDTGPGLDPQLVQRAFHPFFTTKPNGLGLGLAISRALIEAQGGQLWLDTARETPGATFHFTLPFAP